MYQSEIFSAGFSREKCAFNLKTFFSIDKFQAQGRKTKNPLKKQIIMYELTKMTSNEFGDFFFMR